MKTIRKEGIVLFLVLFMMPAVLWGQKRAVLVPSESNITIEGTSSLHDWEEKVEKFDVVMQLQSPGADIESIGSVRFSARSGAVVSDNSLMTGKTHDALQVEKYPEILFRSTEAVPLEVKGSSFKGSMVGELVLNGVTRKVVIGFSGSFTGDKIIVSGSRTLKMSEYNIKPPTAMLGTLKTGDEVTILFNLKFRIQ